MLSILAAKGEQSMGAICYSHFSSEIYRSFQVLTRISFEHFKSARLQHSKNGFDLHSDIMVHDQRISLRKCSFSIHANYYCARQE